MTQTLLQTDEQLQEFCLQLNPEQGISIDTEFMRQKTYFAIPALVQLAQEGTHNSAGGMLSACIDVPLIKNWAPLVTALQRAPYCLAHSPDQDFEIFDQLFGQWQFTIFDTQIAMALLGQQTQISYAQMIQLSLDIEIDKSQSRTDWLRRPLSKAQLDYALADVIHLPKAWKLLKQQLSDKGRLDWFFADCSRQIAQHQKSRVAKNAWRSVKGIKRLVGREFAIAASLAQWREEQAIAADLPRRWMLADEAILDLAMEPDILHAISGRWSILSKHTEQVEELIQNPLQVFLKTDTKAFEALSSTEKKAYSKLKQFCVERAKAMEIDPAAIANRKTLEKLVRGSTGFLDPDNWRHEILLEYVQEHA